MSMLMRTRRLLLLQAAAPPLSAGSKIRRKDIIIPPFAASIVGRCGRVLTYKEEDAQSLLIRHSKSACILSRSLRCRCKLLLPMQTRVSTATCIR